MPAAAAALLNSTAHRRAASVCDSDRKEYGGDVGHGERSSEPDERTNKTCHVDSIDSPLGVNEPSSPL